MLYSSNLFVKDDKTGGGSTFANFMLLPYLDYLREDFLPKKKSQTNKIAPTTRIICINPPKRLKIRPTNHTNINIIPIIPIICNIMNLFFIYFYLDLFVFAEGFLITIFL